MIARVLVTRRNRKICDGGHALVCKRGVTVKKWTVLCNGLVVPGVKQEKQINLYNTSNNTCLPMFQFLNILDFKHENGNDKN